MALQSERRKGVFQGASMPLDQALSNCICNQDSIKRIMMPFNKWTSMPIMALMMFDAVSYTAPPGEEGFDISHEGGEFEVFEDVAAGLAESSG